MKSPHKSCVNHYPIMSKWIIVEDDHFHTKWECPDCKETYQSKKHHGPIDRARFAEQRRAFRNDIVQPTRDGEPSKEFIDTYPKVAEKMFSKDQIKKAKPVWKGVDGW